MTTPTAPYATSAGVAYLMQTTLKGGTDFTDQTIPTVAAVEQVITWVSSQVDLQFAMAGYKVPFAVVEGETWPAHQTTYLQMITAMGSVALAGGHALKPAPALSAGNQGGTGNIFQDMYTAELNKIYDRTVNKTFLRFRADYYSCTPAEEALVIPKGPTTDFMEGKFDPMRFLPLYDVADRIIAIQKSVQDLSISWDYLYSLFDLNKGFGTSIYEPTY